MARFRCTAAPGKQDKTAPMPDGTDTSADIAHKTRHSSIVTVRAPHPQRDADGFVPLACYGVIGDGRSAALSAHDGAIDWWCVPNLDSPPLFDRLLDAPNGGYFSIQPSMPFSVQRRYKADSNVLETTFRTATGIVRLIESHNSGAAGRLPWAELGRRLEGIEGTIECHITLRFSRCGDTRNPYFSKIGKHRVFHAGPVLGVLILSDEVNVDGIDDTGVECSVTVTPGSRHIISIVAGEAEPLVVPSAEDIDRRIDGSNDEWQQWAHNIRYDGSDKPMLLRSALALKLLLYSPSGAIAAAATTSLPERIGGDKNYDYRYAWIRDAGYTIKAFLLINAHAEAKAAFTWLLKQLKHEGPLVVYALSGGPVVPLHDIPIGGYRGSQPVRVGNLASNQFQLGVYGDIFETAACFVAEGNLLDSDSAETLSRLADHCADGWRRPDHGIWELPDARHFTMSKISAWQALDRAVQLADIGHLPTTCRDRWQRERDRIVAWIDTHCWSEKHDAYAFYAGSDKLDASLALAVRFGFDNKDRLRRTVAAIDRELASGPYHYRYSEADKEEGCFLSCSFWMIEAKALLGDSKAARADLTALTTALRKTAAEQGWQGDERNADCRTESHIHPTIGLGILPEMIDPASGAFLGNLPQGLSHLALIHALFILHGIEQHEPAETNR